MFFKLNKTDYRLDDSMSFSLLLTWYLILFAYFAKKTKAQSNVTFDACFVQVVTLSFVVSPAFDYQMTPQYLDVLRDCSGKYHYIPSISLGACGALTQPFSVQTLSPQILCFSNYNFTKFNISVTYKEVSLNYFRDINYLNSVAKCFIQSFNNTGFTCSYSPTERAIIISSGPVALLLCIGAIAGCKIKKAIENRKTEQSEEEKKLLTGIINDFPAMPNYSSQFKV